jgi:hypothetical protein
MLLLEFFAANIRNPHTRRAYARAAEEFLTTERDHPGMAGEIIPERRARSNRNAGRHHRGFAGDFPRNPHTFPQTGCGLLALDVASDCCGARGSRCHCYDLQDAIAGYRPARAGIATRLAGPRVGAFWKPADPALISLPGPAWLGAR